MANGKAGRPSDYTEELADAICEELATSDTSLRQICSRKGMPDMKTVMRWLQQHDDFASKYARAREGQGDVVFDDCGEVERKALKNEIAPDVARVVLQSKQWRASKLAAKKYGAKLDLNHGGSLALTKTGLSDAELEAIAAGRGQGTAGTAQGEGEPEGVGEVP